MLFALHLFSIIDSPYFRMEQEITEPRLLKTLSKDEQALRFIVIILLALSFVAVLSTRLFVAAASASLMILTCWKEFYKCCHEDWEQGKPSTRVAAINVGESVDRKAESENNQVEKKEPATNICSACEKKNDSLKLCNGCKCVWYCDKKCQNRHRREHKKECRNIKRELDKRGGTLDIGTEVQLPPIPDLSPQEKCPICICVLPITGKLHIYNACCGKTLCGGCDMQHKIKNREMNARENAKRAQMKQPPIPSTCAFCRTTLPNPKAELLDRLRKRVERKDSLAINDMANHYGYGDHGLPVDQMKCIDLLGQSAGLGCPSAQCQLGIFHYIGGMGLEKNEEEANKYFKQAAEGGHLISLHNVGCAEEIAGDDVTAMRHWRMSASGGYTPSMEALIKCFEVGLLYHGDLAETVQAFYLARAELWTEDRNQYIEYLKKTGKYKEAYNY